MKVGYNQPEDVFNVADLGDNTNSYFYFLFQIPLSMGFKNLRLGSKYIAAEVLLASLAALQLTFLDPEFIKISV